MNVYVLNRRSLVFKAPGRGMVDVIFVPGRDQIQVIRNIAGMTEISVEGSKGGQPRMPQLFRLRLGMRYVYGHLTEEITEINQSVRVWLAEDFVPPETKAFFFIFSPQVIVHGIKESNDEGQLHWRTAKLTLQEESYTDLLNAISDYVIANSTEGLVIAVYNQLDLYKKLQEDLAPYSIYPVPFTKLKPGPEVRPLYRHFDFTILYGTILLFSGFSLLASLVYLGYAWMNQNHLERDITQVEREIHEYQMRQTMTQVKDPQAVLGSMVKAGDVPPSSMILALGTVAKALGEFDALEINPPVLPPGQTEAPTVTFSVVMKTLTDSLLVDQEGRAKRVLEEFPWIRSIQRTGAQGQSAQLGIELQLMNLPEGDPVSVVPPEVVGVSGTVETPVSVTASSPRLPVDQSVSQSGVQALPQQKAVSESVSQIPDRKEVHP